MAFRGFISAFTVMICYEFNFKEHKRGKMSLVAVFSAMVVAALGEKLLHFFGFSNSACIALAIVSALVWKRWAIIYSRNVMTSFQGILLISVCTLLSTRNKQRPFFSSSVASHDFTAQGDFNSLPQEILQQRLTWARTPNVPTQPSHLHL
jgi:hypothetical protein